LEDTNKKGKHISVEAPSAHGLVRKAAAYGEGWAGMGRAGPVRPDPREDSSEKLICKFQLNLEFWQLLEKFFKEI
jgi:hypothetical protein